MTQPLASTRVKGNSDWHIDPGALLGSWEETIKEHDAWDEDDPLSTIEALKRTKQNFYVYQIDTDTKWDCLPRLLKAAHGTKIKIFAAMNSPYQDSSRCRWFDTNRDGRRHDPPPSNPTDTHDEAQYRAERKFMLTWLDAWEATATALSKLSLKHKDNLVGFVINDFEGWVESADYPTGLNATKLSKSDIKRIYDACHSSNSAFGFYPVLTFPALGRFICRGLIFGVNYGVRLHSGESMVVEYNVPLLPDPVASRLTFFQHTSSERDGVYRSVRVNGVRVWPAPGAKEEIPLNNTGRPEVEHTSLALKLHSGMNRIEIRLDSEAVHERMRERRPVVRLGREAPGTGWRARSGRLMSSSARVLRRRRVLLNGQCRSTVRATCLTSSRASTLPGYLSNDDYRCVHKGVFGVPVLPDDPIKGRMARRLICAPNDSYLLHGLIDGIIPYIGDTELYDDFDSDALDPSRRIRPAPEGH